jgi:phage/plasmid-associated DNA primase
MQKEKSEDKKMTERPNYVYLLRRGDLLNQNIYKIGRTAQENFNRLYQYPKGTVSILYDLCTDCKKYETEILNCFKNKYIQRTDIGREYFEGNPEDMKNDIRHILQGDNLQSLFNQNEQGNSTTNQDDNPKFLSSQNRRGHLYLPELSDAMMQVEFYKRLFDTCYDENKFRSARYINSILISIKSLFIFDRDKQNALSSYYLSKVGDFTFNEELGSTYGNDLITIALENRSKFISLLSHYNISLSEQDLATYLRVFYGYRIYQNKNLFIFNGRVWSDDEIELSHLIAVDLTSFLRNIFLHDKNLVEKISKQLRNESSRNKVIKCVKKCFKWELTFEEKWWLFGFTDKVYDLKEGCFREYRYDDYVSITTGYDWREPTEDEIKTVNNLLNKIMPYEDERNVILRVLCTGLEGRCLEHLIVFNGSGGNGKGLINDLFLASLGNYGFLGNNSILFEKNKTGTNPEKANIHKKRYVLFREPPEKNRFENSVIKELTGSGKFAARSHHDTETEKMLDLTMVVECNKRPLFSEEPTDADIRRIVDILFRSKFTNQDDEVSEENNVYKADPSYKTNAFLQQHKYALLSILFSKYGSFTNSDTCISLNIPDSIRERSNMYLEMSCDILQWFKESFSETKNNKDFIKITDIYETFIKDQKVYPNLTRAEKKKYTKKYIVEYFQTNVFLRKYYSERYSNIRNVVRGWLPKDCIDDEDNEFIEDGLSTNTTEENKFLLLKKYMDTHNIYKKDGNLVFLLNDITDNIVDTFKIFYLDYVKHIDTGDKEFLNGILKDKIKDFNKYLTEKC